VRMTQALQTTNDMLPGPRYDLVVAAPGMPLLEADLRGLIARHPADVELCRRTGPHRAALRLVTGCIYDVVVTLEAMGFEVVRVVATDTSTGRRILPEATSAAEFTIP